MLTGDGGELLIVAELVEVLAARNEVQAGAPQNRGEQLDFYDMEG